MRVVVPFVAGGGVDTVSRIIAGRLGPALGQQVIVDNRSGGRGVIGVEAVSKAAPDGHTFLIVSESFTIMPFIERSLPFDARKSFTPVSASPRSPSCSPFIHRCRRNRSRSSSRSPKPKPGALSYSSGGFAQHLAGEVLKKAGSFDMTHIPYKGGAQAVSDLVGGQVHAGVVGQSPLLPFVRSGKVRILAVTSKSRSAVLPNVPTAVEAGIPGVDLSQWVFMLAPAKTPKSRSFASIQSSRRFWRYLMSAKKWNQPVTRPR